MTSKAGFQAVIDMMPKYMQELVGCEAIGMDTRADRRTLRHKLPASEGIYVLYEHGEPMYVGRSDNLANRLLEHGQLSGNSETATFAFNIAKEEFPASASMSRKGLQRDTEFRRRFDAAKERVRKMDVHVVGVQDPIEQTIFEVYAHLELDTRYNSFENH